MSIILILVIFFPISKAEAQSFFGEHARGWHWYEEKPKKEKKEKPEKSLKAPVATPQDPTALIKAQRQEIERRLHAALIYPTPQNVRLYQEIQKELMDQAERFSKVWEYVVYTNSHLDPSIRNPTNQLARHVFLDEKKTKQQNHIQKLSKRFGLFLFFKEKCQYCHEFAPIVKRFSEEYGWNVVAISVDHGTLAEFPNAMPDNGAARRLGVQSVPTLLAVEPRSQTILPISVGMSSQEEIERRILVLSGGTS